MHQKLFCSRAEAVRREKFLKKQKSKKFPEQLVDGLRRSCGVSSAGRALESHSRGRGFDPHTLHHTPRFLTGRRESVPIASGRSSRSPYGSTNKTYYYQFLRKN